MPTKKKTQKVTRSAVSGKFVTKKKGKKSPRTTVTETIVFPATPKKKKPAK